MCTIGGLSRYIGRYIDVAMLAEFGSIPMFYVSGRCGVAMWFLYLVLKSFSVSPMYVLEVLWSLCLTVAWEITDVH